MFVRLTDAAKDPYRSEFDFHNNNETEGLEKNAEGSDSIYPRDAEC